MTEQEWRASRDPVAMARAVVNSASERKIRLFACACCRRAWQVWGVAPRAAERAAVETTERYVDGAATWEERTAALRALQGPAGADWDAAAFRLAHAAIRAGMWLVATGASVAAVSAATTALEPSLAAAAPRRKEAAKAERSDEERQAQAAILRDLFGPHLPRLPAVSPAWQTWRGATVPRLARAIYEEGAFDRLPVLADALEDAGCTDPEMLAHLRSPGPHVRGCWAVDLILGME